MECFLGSLMSVGLGLWCAIRDKSIYLRHFIPFKRQVLATEGNQNFPRIAYDGNSSPAAGTTNANAKICWIPPPLSLFTPTTGINGEQNLYLVLGVARDSSSTDISNKLINFSLES